MLLAASLPAPGQSDPVYAWTNFAGLPGGPGNADGTGSAARFNYPYGVAVDSAGNVYVADTYNHTIRKVTAAGVVTTLAGSAGNPGSADGTGNAALFYYPTGVAVDSAGNVFVADMYNYTIRKVTAAGVVTTLAGSAGAYGSVDGTGSAALFYYPTGVAVDSACNVFVADMYNNTIRKVTAAGVVTTVGGIAGIIGGADGIGSAANFSWPLGIAVDSVGNLYVADSYNHRISKGTPTTPSVATPPTAVDDTLDNRSPQGATKIAVAQLLANDSDSLGRSLSISTVSAVSGGTVSLSGRWITFTPAAGLADSTPAYFDYVLANGTLSTATARVTLHTPGTSFTTSPATLLAGGIVNNPHGAGKVLTFAAIPNRLYQAEASSDLSFWTPLGSITAGADGRLVITDPGATDSPRFYRFKK
ncbi:MAG: cadherin-like domain-containing protein [Verrucomicrobia bacterium]|nr:cadherin-like domain-containing protein [Verrucomicrobiota bacterium]